MPDPSSRSPEPLLNRADRLGFSAAVLCALHCALLPVAVAGVPAMGLGISGSGDIDQVFVVFAGLLGLATTVIGARRHRTWVALGLLLPGLGLLAVGAFTPLHDHGLAHAALMTAGGLLLGLSHWLNLRLSHRALRAANRALLLQPTCH